MNASEMREQIPVLGYREYWYPALRASKVDKKPVGLKIMGEEIVFFRGGSGEVAALANACPHRGGSLKHGDCHYQGTVACPYHGWVFNEEGECLAVLAEGPESRIPEKARARKYPTKTLRGMVFIWMGEGKPAAIEEDVPPEFFYGEDTLVFTQERLWPVNWRVALENALDSHVMYVHRNSFLILMEPFLQFGRHGNRVRVVNDKACIGYMAEPPTTGRDWYPGLKAYWPKRNWRGLWLWLFKMRRPWSDFPPFNNNEEWDMHTIIDGKRHRSGGHHLPTMFRYDYGTHFYTRCCVPIDAHNTRIIYYHAAHRKSALGRLLHTIYFKLIHSWLMFENFSQQDYRVMGPQRYDLPEHLSPTDAEVVAWRRLLLKARGAPGQSREVAARAVEMKVAAN
ncbi:MAG TPA: Rieske 2Fe-2S domain-containing protein [Burkholderiales bacterium]|nr:Rieske 2Fe-2S domain-containing protein [Burkholderiales bacterium]